MDNKSKDRFEITVLFMVKADWHRKFIGEINRHAGLDGSKFVTGKVFVQDGDIWSKAVDQYELSKCLDNICILKLDYGLHENEGVISIILNQPYFLN